MVANEGLGVGIPDPKNVTIVVVTGILGGGYIQVILINRGDYTIS